LVNFLVGAPVDCKAANLGTIVATGTLVLCAALLR
jgi:hypothetical protein